MNNRLSGADGGASEYDASSELGGWDDIDLVRDGVARPAVPWGLEGAAYINGTRDRHSVPGLLNLTHCEARPLSQCPQLLRFPPHRQDQKTIRVAAAGLAKRIEVSVAMRESGLRIEGGLHLAFVRNGQANGL